jgi:hypothetical protein
VWIRKLNRKSNIQLENLSESLFKFSQILFQINITSASKDDKGDKVPLVRSTLRQPKEIICSKATDALKHQ